MAGTVRKSQAGAGARGSGSADSGKRLQRLGKKAITELSAPDRLLLAGTSLGGLMHGYSYVGFSANNVVMPLQYWMRMFVDTLRACIRHWDLSTAPVLSTA